MVGKHARDDGTPATTMVQLVLLPKMVRETPYRYSRLERFG